MKLDEKGLYFFGRITAGFSHEMRNILSIIRESAGLAEDLIGLLSREYPSHPHLDRIKGALGGVSTLVQRGDEITTQLNRFAHLPEHPAGPVDLGESVKQIVALTRRFARLKKVDMKVAAPESPVLISARPVWLQLLLCEAIEACLDPASGAGMKLSSENIGNEAAVLISMEKEGLRDRSAMETFWNSGKISAVREMAGCLGGRIEPCGTAPGLKIIFPKGTEAAAPATEELLQRV